MPARPRFSAPPREPPWWASAAGATTAPGPRRREEPGPPPLPRPTKETPVVVERRRIDHRHGIIFTSPIDGRVMFILPWGDLSYIGTTDTDPEESRDRLGILPDEVVYLLRSASARFPNARLPVEDVRGAWAGLR